MTLPEKPSDDQLIATVASILFDDGNLDAVSLLLDCELKTIWANDYNDDFGLNLILRGPYLTVKDFIKAHGEIDNNQPRILKIIKNAFELVTPTPFYIDKIVFSVLPVAVKENWRTELLNAIRGGYVHNQAIGNTQNNITVWEGLRFRSKSELRIAQALDRAGVLYFPNCKARLGIQQRENREPDFLICHKGKWGLLEVDGEPYHPATRAVHDHAKDRLFKQHGITLIDHFDAGECYNNPDKVVKEFLQNLLQAYGN